MAPKERKSVMGIMKKMIAGVLACSIAGTAGALQSAALSVDSTEGTSYYSTLPDESKALDETPFQVFDIYNAYYGIEKPAVTTTAPPTVQVPATTTTTTTTAVTTTTTTVTTIPQYISRGIDVSEHQAFVDWQRVKNSGTVDFAIIRAGYGEEYYQVDKQFIRNMECAQAVGMDVGLYWYSYADSVESARKEAEVCLETIKGYSFNYPVYLDVEEDFQRDMDPAVLSAIVDTFCSTLQENGYYVGIYSCASILECHIYEHVRNKYDVWVAEYNDGIYTYSGDYGIWQYTPWGWVDGIEVNIDLNYCYKDYPKAVGVNLVGGKLPQSTAPPVTTTTNTTTTTASPVTTDAPQTTTTTTASQIIGVKLSAENGTVSMDELSRCGVSFAMIKVSESGPVLDSEFRNNVQAAKNVGMNIGLYWHSKALTVEDMRKDAELFFSLCYGMSPDYPVYLDMTDDVYKNSGLTTEQISELIRAFCSYMESKNYYVGVHGDKDFLLSRVDSSVFRAYDVWLSVSDGNADDFPYNYGFDGNGRLINGIEMLTCYRNYPAVMKAYHLNGF